MLERFFERTDSYNVVMDVTPAIAERWICELNTHNRKLVDAHVERLAREMKAGRWRTTHQGIAFSPTACSWTASTGSGPSFSPV